MKTSHKRARAYDHDYDNWLRASQNLNDPVLIEAMTARRQRQINLSETAARTIVMAVLKEDLRLAKLPYRRNGRGV